VVGDPIGDDRLMQRVSRQPSLLPWIVAFKALKATILAALGAMLLLAIHRDPVDFVAEIAMTVHLPLTSGLVERALALAFRATPRKEEALAAAAFGYAILLGAEGIGLYLRRPWARWFTIGATSSLIPIEVYEIVREPRPLRVLVLLVNIAVVVYLWKRKDVFE
jgi:uncharacterized membrane protein (DUF2068 family)